MEPIKFKEMNGTAAKDQAQYLPLPMFRDDFNVISCWKMSVWERIKVLFTGVVWLKLSHSRKAFITPSQLTITPPFIPVDKEKSETDIHFDDEWEKLETNYKDFFVALVLLSLVCGGVYWLFSA